MTQPERFGVLFDCDGTLVDSLGRATESFEHALDRVGAGKLPSGDLKHRFGQGADKILMELLGDELKAQKAFGLYLEHQAGLAMSTPLHPGIRDLLNHLHHARVPMGIVTGRHAVDLALVLNPHDLAPYFSVLVADSDVARPKPAPDGLLLACQTLGLEPERTLYVGDSVNDMLAARAAGCVAVAALWDGLSDKAGLANTHPAVMAQSPSELEAFVGTWSQARGQANPS